MKFLNKIGALGVLALAMTACVDQDPDIQDFPSADVDFTYEVNSDGYKVDYYVVSEIKFNNTSSKTGDITWNFGSDKIEIREGDKSSQEVVVKYKEAGRYNVTLTITGVGTCTYPLLISDIQPKLTIKEDTTAIDNLIEVNLTEVEFDLELPNPENKDVAYTFTFPSGTTDVATGQEITSLNVVWSDGALSQELPKVKFSDIGSRQIQVEATYDIATGGENRDLEPSFLNVQVACDTPAPTLYYAAKDGNIKALKLVDAKNVSYGVYPYDLGVISGDNPFNLCYGKYTVEDKEEGTTTEQEYVYILDAGKQYYYLNEPIGAGDGKITAMAVDGTAVNVVISNVGLNAYNDPFCGTVDGSMLYYSDRNMGIRKIELSARNQMETATDSYAGENYFVKDTWLNYYGGGIAYGAIHSSILRDSKGVWWLGKHFNGNGIYRFKESDIHKDGNVNPAAPPYGKVLTSSLIRSFTIDEVNNMLYVWRMETSTPGFYVYDLPANNSTDIDIYSSAAKVVNYHKMMADPINTTASEGVYTTQMAVDANSGRVFFAYRSTDATPSGIYYYDPNSPGKSGACCSLYGNTEGETGLGIVINPNKTKLF